MSTFVVFDLCLQELSGRFILECDDASPPSADARSYQLPFIGLRVAITCFTYFWWVCDDALNSSDGVSSSQLLKEGPNLILFSRFVVGFCPNGVVVVIADASDPNLTAI